MLDYSKKTVVELYDLYKDADSFKDILASFQVFCKKLNIDLLGYYAEKTDSDQFVSSTKHYRLYQIIRSKTVYRKLNELWSLFDKKTENKDYSIPLINRKVLIIGSGPVGLRLSIECALLGVKVVVIEKRDQFSRNNLVHLWPYAVVDLKNIGVKHFYGKFCTGSINHISIRKLQSTLLKIALLVGVEVHFNVSYEDLIVPSETKGWRARVLPENHLVSEYDFDVIVAADGQRHTLPGFERKPTRYKLAIGITANFVNNFTEDEIKVQERSGIDFIHARDFFETLKKETNGIDLENIVYYKDDTHYFVMTAKKQSLIDKRVIKKDYAESAQLLSKDNIDYENLCKYAKEAAFVSTAKKLNCLDFATNHYGQPDVAIFDFTTLCQAVQASKFIEFNKKPLLMALVGDSLIRPFWPTGTGIARGFLSALDTAWMIRGWALDKNPCDLFNERENIYQILSQTTNENLSRDHQKYSMDPSTRYSNLKTCQMPLGSIGNIDADQQLSKTYCHWKTLLNWSQMVVQPYNIKIENFTTSWRDGLAFCAIIHRFRMDLISYDLLEKQDSSANLRLVFDLMKSKLGITVDDWCFKPDDIANKPVPDKNKIFKILDKIYSIFRLQPLIDVSIESGNKKSEKMTQLVTKTSKRKTSYDFIPNIENMHIEDKKKHGHPIDLELCKSSVKRFKLIFENMQQDEIRTSQKATVAHPYKFENIHSPVGGFLFSKQTKSPKKISSTLMDVFSSTQAASGSSTLTTNTMYQQKAEKNLLSNVESYTNENQPPSLLKTPQKTLRLQNMESYQENTNAPTLSRTNNGLDYFTSPMTTENEILFSYSIFENKNPQDNVCLANQKKPDPILKEATFDYKTETLQNSQSNKQVAWLKPSQTLESGHAHAFGASATFCSQVNLFDMTLTDKSSQLGQTNFSLFGSGVETQSFQNISTLNNPSAMKRFSNNSNSNSDGSGSNDNRFAFSKYQQKE